jgi:hypothetical protein
MIIKELLMIKDHICQVKLAVYLSIHFLRKFNSQLQTKDFMKLIRLTL